MTVADPRTPIVLVGLPGAGKTTAGRAAAARLGWDFVDVDELIAEAAGCSIPEVFAREGEAGFRRREREATRTLSGRTGVVIAPGGGWMANPGCADLLRPPARIIHLRVGVDAALARMAADRASRPLLSGPEPAVALEALRRRREAAYAGADVVLDTEVMTLQAVVDSVVRLATPEGRP